MNPGCWAASISGAIRAEGGLYRIKRSIHPARAC
jgi:hypothetical protein